MTVKIYGHAGATCTKRVIITLNELGMSYELIVVDILKGEQRQPDYLAKHPFGKLPYVEDDGNGEGPKVHIFESRAICRYLVTRYGKESRLLPAAQDLEAYARFEEACSVEQNYFEVPASTLVFQVMFAPMRGMATDDAAVKKNLTMLDETLQAYDQILSKRKFIAGDDFTVADIFHGPYGDLAIKCGAKESFEKYPNVQKWWKDITSRESFKALGAPFP